MSARLKKHLEELKLLRSSGPKKRKQILKHCSVGLVDCISECALNCLNNAVPLKPSQFKKLKRQRKVLRKLASKKVSRKAKKRALNQQGGFLVPLLTAVLTALAEYFLKK